MSRGPGACQRRILERLESGTPFYLTELLPECMTPRHAQYAAAYQALWRAARTLDAAGRIDLLKYRAGKPGALLVLRTGEPQPDKRPADPRHSRTRRVWSE